MSTPFQPRAVKRLSSPKMPATTTARNIRLTASNIYFNSDRSGLEQIWRMHPDGTGQERVTNDDTNDWFPHFSRDGKWMVFLSYPKDVTGHPANQDVWLRIMSMSDGKIRPLAHLLGGREPVKLHLGRRTARTSPSSAINLLPQ